MSSCLPPREIAEGAGARSTCLYRRHRRLLYKNERVCGGLGKLAPKRGDYTVIHKRPRTQEGAKFTAATAGAKTEAARRQAPGDLLPLASIKLNLKQSLESFQQKPVDV